MKGFVAPGTQSNQILLGIIAKAAALIDVVDLEIEHPAAMLAALGVALQHLLAEELPRASIRS